MRKFYGMLAGVMLGDLLVFWLCKKLGVLGTSGNAPAWALYAFATPLVIVGLVGFLLGMYDLRSGWTYSVNGGERVYFREQPLAYLFNVLFKLFICALLCIMLISVMLNYDDRHSADDAGIGYRNSQHPLSRTW